MEHNVSEDEIQAIVSRIVKEFGNEENEELAKNTNNPYEIPVEMSARHVHLTQADVETLFGADAELIVKKNLTLPGFLSEQRVSIVTSKGVFKNVGVLGPVRDHTQVELSATDAFQLGLDAPVNLSGDFNDAADCFLVGSHGMICAKESVIIAKAHIHMNPIEAKTLGFSDHQKVDVEVLGKRPHIIRDVVIRVNEGMHAMMHIDMDEANAIGYQTIKKVIICR